MLLPAKSSSAALPEHTFCVSRITRKDSVANLIPELAFTIEVLSPKTALRRSSRRRSRFVSASLLSGAASVIVVQPVLRVFPPCQAVTADDPT